MSKHATKRISLKRVSVDVGMIPAIKWLNSFDSVHSTHCCEGDHKNGSQPYVVFWCLQFGTLLDIVRETRDYAECSIFWPVDDQPWRYCLRFNSKKALQQFIRNIT